MKRIVTWALALTLALGLFSPGVAQAHVKTWNTTVSMRVRDTTIERGERVKFRGALRASKRQCFRGKQITITRKGQVVATTTTRKRGRYAVSKNLRKGGRYIATFSGYTFGAHPHSHICGGSSSSVVRIRIQR